MIWRNEFRWPCASVSLMILTLMHMIVHSLAVRPRDMYDDADLSQPLTMNTDFQDFQSENVIHDQDVMHSFTEMNLTMDEAAQGPPANLATCVATAQRLIDAKSSWHSPDAWLNWMTIVWQIVPRTDVERDQSPVGVELTNKLQKVYQEARSFGAVLKEVKQDTQLETAAWRLKAGLTDYLGMRSLRENEGTLSKAILAAVEAVDDFVEQCFIHKKLAERFPNFWGVHGTDTAALPELVKRLPQIVSDRVFSPSDILKGIYALAKTFKYEEWTAFAHACIPYKLRRVSVLEQPKRGSLSRNSLPREVEYSIADATIMPTFFAMRETHPRDVTLGHYPNLEQCMQYAGQLATDKWTWHTEEVWKQQAERVDKVMGVKYDRQMNLLLHALRSAQAAAVKLKADLQILAASTSLSATTPAVRQILSVYFDISAPNADKGTLAKSLIEAGGLLQGFVTRCYSRKYFGKQFVHYYKRQEQAPLTCEWDDPTDLGNEIASVIRYFTRELWHIMVGHCVDWGYRADGNVPVDTPLLEVWNALQKVPEYMAASKYTRWH
mmetsp:Transcript_31638/g.73859  ORF Transcript_31638/g.73859 Transcript_31638/m.73859 type:complete len:551 (+) Transcript_31638:162-1814(+)